jgi:uncharacterized protein involved in outer membrane biogenesis
MRILLAVTRTAVYLLAAAALVVVAAIAAFETGWGKNQIRELIVRQANQYLTATLDIGRLEGSLFRGLTLREVTLSREGRSLIAIDEVSLAYSIRELIEGGTIIRRLHLIRPRFDIARQDDGRWNIAALVRRSDRRQERTGPGRPIRIVDLQVVDGRVAIHDPLVFGVARVPRRYDALNLALSFHYQPVDWTLDFTRASWQGGQGELTVNGLTGGISNGRAGWSFQNL